MTKCCICGKEAYMYSNNMPMLPIGWSEEWIKDKNGRVVTVRHYCKECKSSADGKVTNQYVSKR